MITTYVGTANNGTGGQAIGAANTAVEIYKIIVGNPVAAGNLWLFNIPNPGASNNVNLFSKITFPGSLATGQLPFVLDLSDAHGSGIEFENGFNFMFDQTLQVTVLWDYAGQSQGHL